MEWLESLDQGAQHPFRFVGPIGALRPLLIALYYLGHPIGILVVLLLAVAGLQLYRQTRSAIILAVAVLLALVAARGSKIVFDRTRPNVSWTPIPEPESKSFPSGHALAATALYPLLGVIIRRRTGRRWPAILGVLLAFLAGLQRLLVGHNYVSDVLAGWAAGALILLIAMDLEARGSAKQHAESGGVAT